MLLFFIAIRYNPAGFRVIMNGMNGQDAAVLIPCVLMLLMILFLIAIVVVWFIALIHAAVSNIESKPVWILVILIGGPIGAVAYFIARPFSKGRG